MDWRYGRQRLEAADLDAYLDSRDDSWRGLSLTMPLKLRAYERAQERDRLATATGSVNTLTWDESRRLRGFNTDVAGLVRALADKGVTHCEHVTIFGGGATAASAIVAAAELGASDVQVVVRDRAKVAPLEPIAANVGLRMRSVDFLHVEQGSALVISTLAGGVRPSAGIPAALRASALLLDVSYDPWPSALAEDWVEAGGRAVSGLGMLVHQALVQVRIFVGGDPEVPLPDEHRVLAAMRAAVR